MRKLDTVTTIGLDIGVDEPAGLSHRCEVVGESLGIDTLQSAALRGSEQRKHTHHGMEYGCLKVQAGGLQQHLAGVQKSEPKSALRDAAAIARACREER